MFALLATFKLLTEKATLKNKLFKSNENIFLRISHTSTERVGADPGTLMSLFHN
jgi:hypothetical protein